MYRIKHIASVLLAFVLCQACIQEDTFGFSSFKSVTAFELPMQDGVTTINAAERLIAVPIGQGVDLMGIAPLNISISNLATISPLPDEVQDFSEPVTYTVTAEDGSTAVWTVTVVSTLPSPQLPNSNFDTWYTVGDYQQPGESQESTIWGTANRAIAIAGDANTIAVDLGNGDLAATMTSVAAPLLVRMAAATLFTGTFTDGFPNPADPRSNIDFGTPFSGSHRLLAWRIPMYQELL